MKITLFLSQSKSLLCIGFITSKKKDFMNLSTFIPSLSDPSWVHESISTSPLQTRIGIRWEDLPSLHVRISPSYIWMMYFIPSRLKWIFRASYFLIDDILKYHNYKILYFRLFHFQIIPPTKGTENKAIKYVNIPALTTASVLTL